MPIGLDNALQIAKSALHTNQYLINIAGQNIANANNKDYTRKIAEQQAKTPLTNIAPGSMGTGVKVKEVKRVLDKFLEVQITKNTSKLSHWETTSKYLDQIERIFNSFGDASLNGAMDEFWNAWLDVSNNPSDASARTSLLEKSKNMEEYFNDTINSLEELQRRIDSEITGKVDEINTLTEKIASLNDEIYKIEVGDNHANDLRDERDKLIRKLAQYLDITVVEENNKFNVFLSNGNSLISGTLYNKLSTSGNATNNNFSTINFVEQNGISSQDVTNIIREGELKGLIDLRDSTIADYLFRLNKIANTLYNEVNKIHSAGVGIEALSEVTGNTSISNSDLVFSSENLSHSISSGDFSIVVYDSNGNAAVNTYTIGSIDSFDSNINSLDELASAINNTNNLTAQVVNGKLKISAANGYSFAFANDETGVVSALGLNTFFKGENYSFTKIVDLSASKVSGSTNILSVGTYNENILTGDEYTIDFTGGNINITDNTTGKSISDYRTSILNGKFSLKFDGISIQFDSASQPSSGVYSVHNIESASIINEKNFSNHVLSIDFSTGTNSISIFDVTDNISIMNDDYSISQYNLNGENYKLIKLDTYGVAFTIKDDEYGTLKVNPNIITGKTIKNSISDENINFIAAGKIDISGTSATSIGVGDNRVALEIADLRNSKTMNNSSETITDNLGKLLSKVGIDSNNAKSKIESLKISKEGLQKQRDNISGVSIDEEMTRLIQIQHSYIASAKLLNIIDRLMENLLSSVR